MLYVEFNTEISAYEIAQLMSDFGDVYCVKDAKLSAFVEFHQLSKEQTLDQIKVVLKK